MDLLFLEENREYIMTGSWTSLAEQAGYAPGTSKGAILRCKNFRRELEKRLGEYQVGMQFQAVMVTDTVLTGENKSPLASLQLAAAKDTLDRSSKFVKRSEQKIESDMPQAIMLMPAKEEIDD